MKNKILIVNPPGTFFPLGMAYVLSCLERHHIDFDFADSNFGYGYKKLLKKNDYFAVASGGLISQYRFFMELFDTSRKLKPGIFIILGGNITKDMKTEFLFEKLHIDYGIVGEGETSLPFLIDSVLNNNIPLSEVPGLIYKDSITGKIRKNPVRRLDLSEENILPAWHCFDVDHYIATWELGIYGNRRCMPVITARGCKGGCSFCSPTIGTYAKRPIEHVIEEIELLCEKYSFDWIYFVNEMFYPTKQEIIQFCESFKLLNRKIEWVCELRVDSEIDAETFRIMKSAGCVAVVCGVESGSDRILSLMNKKTTSDMIIKFFKTAETAGLPCEGSIQVGNEEETEEDIKKTIDMVTDGKMRVNERLPIIYPGTKIYKNAVDRGLIKNEWEYLQNLDFTADIWDYSWPKKRYLNISAIPTERFWKTVLAELRRFNTFNLRNFAAKNISYSYKYNMFIRVNGLCAECGSEVSFVTPKKILGVRTYCRKCFRTVQFNLYELPEFRDHYNRLRIRLREVKRLAVIGTRIEATYMLQYDYFGLNYDSIVAFVETDKKPSVVSDFCHIPTIPIEKLPELNADALLIVDDPFGSVEMKVRSFYLKKYMIPPAIYLLLPDEKLPYHNIVRFIRKHSDPTVWNRIIVIIAIQLPVFFGNLQGRLLSVIKAHYGMFNKNRILRNLLQIVQR